MEKERIAGTIDYDELVAGNGIVLLQERAELYDIEAALGDTVEVDYETESGQIQTKTYTVMGIVDDYSYSGFSKCFTLPEQLMNEATGIDCTGTISVITDMEKFDTVEAALNQRIDGNSDLVIGHLHFLLILIFCLGFASDTISKQETKVDRKLQSKTEKSESKNEAFYIETMRGFWEMWFIS